jgi:hypothetical protein
MGRRGNQLWIESARSQARNDARASLEVVDSRSTTSPKLEERATLVASAIALAERTKEERGIHRDVLTDCALRCRGAAQNARVCAEFREVR